MSGLSVGNHDGSHIAEVSEIYTIGEYVCLSQPYENVEVDFHYLTDMPL